MLIIALVSARVSAWEHCLPNDEQTKACKVFVKETLEPAVFEDPTLPKENPQHRFVKDEKQATKFLKAYDPAKLSLANQHCLFEHARKSETNLAQVKEDLGCETSFTMLNFFRGLIQGVKLNKWGTKTVKLAEGTIEHHVKYVLDSNPSLLEMIISFNILRDAQVAGLLKGKFKPAGPFLLELDKQSEELSKSIKAMKEPVSWEQKKSVMLKEKNITKEYLSRWNSKF